MIPDSSVLFYFCHVSSFAVSSVNFLLSSIQKNLKADTMSYGFSSAVFPGCYWGSYGYPLGYSVGCGYGSTYSPVGYGFGYGYNGSGAFSYRRFWPYALY
ncbi:hypothetical protein Celaphus_00019440 [Cervus elaphus hippelaphus]|uniref:KRTAP8-1 n=1 Tax=Cervus elaphus hippelaphus TaxID=46360 RepID=A0A212C3P5_CEREH|nr:hypothetical protein Celaphus_00019440 [Cervus elaphus hippelaphus]